MSVATEVELVALLDQVGIDFRTSVAEQRQQFGAENNWGVEGNLYIPITLRQPLAGLGTEWKIHIPPPHLWSIAPLRFDHEFHPDPKEAKVNHAKALESLQEHFGPGVDNSVSNTWARTWQVGCFAIKLTTWPAKLNRGYNNVYHRRNPYLYVSANIAIETPYPPLDWCADYPVAEARKKAAAFAREPYGGNWSMNSPQFTRRNPPALAGQFSQEESLVWLEEDAFVLANAQNTVRIPRSEWAGLLLWQLRPGRFSGYAELELQTQIAGQKPLCATRLWGEKAGSLDIAAKALAARLGLPLTVREDQDNG